MEKLRPCPFCGNTLPYQIIRGKMFNEYPESTWPENVIIYGIVCNNLKCNAKVDGFLMPAEAAAAWNCRANEEDHPSD